MTEREATPFYLYMYAWILTPNGIGVLQAINSLNKQVGVHHAVGKSLKYYNFEDVRLALKRIEDMTQAEQDELSLFVWHTTALRFQRAIHYDLYISSKASFWLRSKGFDADYMIERGLAADFKQLKLTLRDDN